MPRVCLTVTTSPSYKTPLVRYDVGTLKTDIVEEFTPTTNGSVVMCTVDWAYSVWFLRHMLGWSEKNGTKLRRVLPEFSSWDDDTFAVSARSTKWFGGSAPTVAPAMWPRPLYIEYAVTFAAPLYVVKEDSQITYEHQRFCVWKTRRVAQNEKLPGASMKFVNDTLPANSGQRALNEVGVKTGRVVDLSCKWLDVPFVDYTQLSDLSNKINSSEVTWNNTTYKAETVLFTGWDVDARNNCFGDPTHDITFNFSIRADGRTWNKFWDATAAGADKYVLVTDNGISGGNKVYQAADLNNLWKFSA